jgi:hypothetical protein
MIYWPGTKIPKSFGNAFDWRNTAQGLFSKTDLLNNSRKPTNTSWSGIVIGVNEKPGLRHTKI